MIECISTFLHKLLFVFEFPEVLQYWFSPFHKAERHYPVLFNVSELDGKFVFLMAVYRVFLIAAQVEKL